MIRNNSFLINMTSQSLSVHSVSQLWTISFLNIAELMTLTPKLTLLRFDSRQRLYDSMINYTSVKMFLIWRSGYKIAFFTVPKCTNYFPENSFWLFPVRIISRTLWRSFNIPAIWLVEGVFSVINASVTLKSSIFHYVIKNQYDYNKYLFKVKTSV